MTVLDSNGLRFGTQLVTFACELTPHVLKRSLSFGDDEAAMLSEDLDVTHDLWLEAPNVKTQRQNASADLADVVQVARTYVQSC